MGDKTGIEWTSSTWTPIRARNKANGKVGWHCKHVTEACKFCYAEGFNKLRGTGLPFKPGHRKDIEIFLDEKMLLNPIRWQRPRKIFVCSMTDLFADFVTDDMIDRMFAVMALCPQHTFQVLTKRPARMREYMLEKWQATPAQEFAGIKISAGGVTGRRSQIEAACEPFLERLGLVDTENDALWTADGRCKAMQWAWPLPNVWLGTSVHDQASADEFVPLLLSAPAAVRFVSYEPALGPVDFTRIWVQKPVNEYDPGMVYDALRGHLPGPDDISDEDGNPLPRLDWIICGGESGPHARPMHPAWARSVRDQCAAAGVAFHFKQWGEWLPWHHFNYAAIEDDDEQTRFKTMEWEDGRWKDVGYPMWCDWTDGSIDDAQCVGRVGKKRAGRLLDGRTHDEFPNQRGQ